MSDFRTREERVADDTLEVLEEMRDVLHRIADSLEGMLVAPASPAAPPLPPRPLSEMHIKYFGGPVKICTDPMCGCRDANPGRNIEEVEK